MQVKSVKTPIKCSGRVYLGIFRNTRFPGGEFNATPDVVTVSLSKFPKILFTIFCFHATRKVCVCTRIRKKMFKKQLFFENHFKILIESRDNI